MSILINGIEMPKDCLTCPFCDVRCVCVVNGEDVLDFLNIRPNICPLIYVPTHGRLINADALKKMWDDELARLLEKGIEYLDYHVDTLFSDIKHDVDKMPTIIPAEEGDA